MVYGAVLVGDARIRTQKRSEFKTNIGIQRQIIQNSLRDPVHVIETHRQKYRQHLFSLNVHNMINVHNDNLKAVSNTISIDIELLVIYSYCYVLGICIFVQIYFRN